VVKFDKDPIYRTKVIMWKRPLSKILFIVISSSLMVLILLDYIYYYSKKKTRGKAGHAQNILPVMTASGQGLFRSRDFVTSGKKGPTRADMAWLPVAHAQNILPVPE
jgi:hypothetical protein